MTLNLVENRVLKPLTSLPMGYRDQAELMDDSRKAIKLENNLKNAAINHFYIDKGTLDLCTSLLTLTCLECNYLLCGYDKGCITFVTPKYYSSKSSFYCPCAKTASFIRQITINNVKFK